MSNTLCYKVLLYIVTHFTTFTRRRPADPAEAAGRVPDRPWHRNGPPELP